MKMTRSVSAPLILISRTPVSKRQFSSTKYNWPLSCHGQYCHGWSRIMTIKVDPVKASALTAQVHLNTGLFIVVHDSVRPLSKLLKSGTGAVALFYAGLNYPSVSASISSPPCARDRPRLRKSMTLCQMDYEVLCSHNWLARHPPWAGLNLFSICDLFEVVLWRYPLER